MIGKWLLNVTQVAETVVCMIVCYTDYDTNNPVNLIENLRENMFLTWEASVIVCVLKLVFFFLNARQENESFRS